MGEKKKISLKSLLIILIFAVFIGVLVLSYFLLTTVRKVEVRFVVAGNTDIVAVQKELDKNLGKNINFINDADIQKTVSEFGYIELVSIERVFPNVLKIAVKERVEAYSVVEGETVYVLSDEARLLKTVSKSDFVNADKLIELDMGDVVITEKIEGQVIKTTNDELLTSVLDTVRETSLTTGIKSIKLVQYAAQSEFSDIEVQMRTGVKICIYEAEDRGTEKLKAALSEYDSATGDFEKVSGTIYAWYDDASGKVEVSWSGVGNK
jgi:hypothetical protein